MSIKRWLGDCLESALGVYDHVTTDSDEGGGGGGGRLRDRDLDGNSEQPSDSGMLRRTFPGMGGA